MKAAVISRISKLNETTTPLDFIDLPVPEPGDTDLLLRVSVCGVCHTELDEIEGRTPPPSFPMTPGHQVIGRVEKCGAAVRIFGRGDRVGVAWIYSACGACEHCRSGNENLCSEFLATGRDAHGGYAEYMVVPERFAFRIPEIFSDSEAAPLLCAGAIGYRSMRLTNLTDGQSLGLTGFGASAHLVLKMVRHSLPNTPVSVFARSEEERNFSRELGAAWAGDTEEIPPESLHAIIDTTPAWSPILHALRVLRPGGRLVINAIRKEEGDKNALLQLDYSSQLWMEKEIKSVANVSRRDVQEFLELAAEIPIRPEVQEYPFADANAALMDLKQRRIRGAKVLRF